MSSISERTDWPLDAIPRQWIDNLFERMLAYYGHKFTDLWEGIDLEAVKRTWGVAMAKLTPAEMKAGVDALKRQEWPPTLPQFIVLCRGSLDPVKAYYEAVAGLQARAEGKAGNWSHPAIYWAAMDVAYELRTHSYSQLRERWERALATQISKEQWPAIPEPSLQLPAPAQGKRDTAIYRQAHEQVQRMTARGRSADIDHLRWAKRILKRAEQPNHGLQQWQIDWANFALKNVEKNP